MQAYLLPVLLGLQLLLLMRQSLLLLRPPCDVPAVTATKTERTYMQRIRQHGSGAAAAFLLILSLLFASPSLFALLRTHTVWVSLAIIWAVIHFTALLATGLCHFCGLAFSSRDAGPADFGRRLPFWPDGVLWLCELGYQGLLYLAFVFSLNGQNLHSAFRVAINLAFLQMLLFVYRQNWQMHGKTQRCQPGYSAKIIALEQQGDRENPLYLLRLSLEISTAESRAKLPQKLHQPQFIPMGFCILRFAHPKEKHTPRWKQHEHPVSLLSWRQNALDNTDKPRHIELEFALEMKGFLQYIRPQPSQGPQQPLAVGSSVRVWGPYYDAQPEFLHRMEREGRLLYIGCKAGLAPFLQYLEWLKQNPPPSRLNIVLLRLLEGSGAVQTFWARKLQQTVRHLPPAVCVQTEELPLPPYLGRLYGSENIFHNTSNRLLRRRLTAWQDFRTEKETEQFQEAIAGFVLRLYEQGFGQHTETPAQSFRSSQTGLRPFIAQLRQCSMYRGPSGLGKLIEPCLELQFWQYAP